MAYLSSEEECTICTTSNGTVDSGCSRNGDCICREFGELCASDDSKVFLIFVLTVGGQMGMQLLQALLFLREIFSNKRDAYRSGGKAESLTPIERVVIMTYVGCLIRLSWICHIYATNGFHGYPLTMGCLQKIPHVLWMGSFFYLILVWSDISDQMITLKRTSPDAAKRRLRQADYFNLMLCICIIPIFVTGLALPGYSYLVSAADGFQAIIICVLIYGAMQSGGGLISKLRAQLPKQQAATQAQTARVVQVMWWSIFLGCTGAAIGVLGVLYALIFVKHHFTVGRAYAALFMKFAVAEPLVVVALFETKRRQYWKGMLGLVSSSLPTVVVSRRQSGMMIDSKFDNHEPVNSPRTQLMKGESDGVALI
jgi:uncharacterized membrane protein